MIKLTRQIDPGYTLILPAVAVGNVAQLAVDLLIYNSDMKKIGQIASPDFIPFLGPDPYDKNSSDICTAADFYLHEEKRIIALQIRSPPAAAAAAAAAAAVTAVNENEPSNFFKKLRDLVNELKISKVIILTSKWQFVRIDSELRCEATMRYVASASVQLENEKIFQEFEWKKLEERSDPRSDERRLEIRGGGFAAGLFEFLSSEKIPCAVLMKFCSEGNNGPDAKDLAHYFNAWIPIVTKNRRNGSIDWKEPPSWRHIFGHRAPPQIY